MPGVAEEATGHEPIVYLVRIGPRRLAQRQVVEGPADRRDLPADQAPEEGLLGILPTADAGRVRPRALAPGEGPGEQGQPQVGRV